MKSILKKSCLVVTATMMLASCKKFDEINNDPFAANGRSGPNRIFYK
jgi:hypothetical protein